MNKDYLDLKLLEIQSHYQIEMLKASKVPFEYMSQRHPEIKGYILLQEYPGCRKKIGDFEPYTSGEFSKYPNIWKPVYHKEIEREKKINQLLGEN